MYKEFYSFTTYPFALTPDPQFLYLSENHRQCLLYLLSGLEREHGIIVLTGEIGTGKTLVLQSLVKQLGDEVHVAFLVHSNLSSMELLQHACHEFGLEFSRETKGELLTALRDFIVSHTKRGEKFIIIIDEAQNLSADVLEELRLLINFESSERNLIQIILAGHPKLEDTLQLKELDQLRQRIGIHCRLAAMSPHETRDYIEKRLSIAGAKYPVFTSAAMDEIFIGSKGIPRVINLLCDLALFSGWAEGQHEISLAIVKRAAEQLHVDTSETSVLHHSRPHQDDNGVRANGISVPQEPMSPEFADPSGGPASVEPIDRRPSHRDIFNDLIDQKMQEQEQIEKHLSQRRCKFPKHLVFPASLVIVSLLGVGITLQSTLLRGTFGKYTTRTGSGPAAVMPPSAGGREALIFPQSTGGREAPIFPQSTGGREAPKKMQWAQTSVSYQLPIGKPLTVPLPQLLHTPDTVSVQVTLEASTSLPVWLKFDPAKLTLSGAAPATEADKTYHLIFRAQTPGGLASLVQVTVRVIPN